MVVTDMRESFKRLPGDTSTYSLGDAEGAVRLARTAPVLAVDIETGSATSVGRWEVKAVAVADEQRAFVLDPRDPRGAAAIRDCLRVARRLVFHNAAYDVPALCAAGLMELESIGEVHDTLVTARLAWPGRGTSNSLGPLAERVLGGDYDRFKNALTDGFKSVSKGRVSKGEMFDRLGVASPAFVAYAAFDVIVTARVYAALPGHLSQALNPGLPGLRRVDAARLDQREQVVNRALLQASAVGLILDEDAVDSVIDALRAQADDSRKELVAAGVDPDGRPSVVKGSILAMLHASGRIPSSWPRLQNGALSTDKRWMSKLEGQPLVAAAVRMLEAQRFIKDYTGGTLRLTHQGRVRPQVSVLAAVTGRMSYSQPAIQQFPGPVRRMFAFDRPATSFDWSSIEPVVVGNLARADMSGFEAGLDIYMPVAERARVTRSEAKTVLLALLYGQGVPGLALRLNVSEQEARRISEAVKSAMPEITALIRKVRAYGDRFGMVQTISGRIAPLERDYRSGGNAFTGYLGVNYLVQGSGYDLLAEAIYAMHQRGIAGHLLLALHDELVVGSEVADEVERIMLTPPQDFIEAAGRVPVLRLGRVDLGRHWQDKG